MTLTVTGEVVEFDASVGLGRVVAAGAGGAGFGFHCTQITGGSRTIEVGTAVTFSLVPGRLGRWEAAAVTPVEEG